jgi:hypothetical protein
MNKNFLLRKLYIVAAMAASVFAVVAFHAPEANAQACVTTAANCAPPPGAIFDLAGQAVPHNTFTEYSTNFLAPGANTNLTFAFREDPAFLHLSNVVVTDVTHPGGNILINGDFALGPVGASAPTGWTYLNQYGASAGGRVSTGCGLTGNNCYNDGAVAAYDAITQILSTTSGDTYNVDFFLTDNGSLTTFSQLSTDGNDDGNGIDLLVYAGIGIPAPVGSTTAVPEPTSLALFGAGLFGLGLYRRRRNA